jgi:hypothetical protein
MIKYKHDYIYLQLFYHVFDAHRITYILHPSQNISKKWSTSAKFSSNTLTFGELFLFISWDRVILN